MSEYAQVVRDFEKAPLEKRKQQADRITKKYPDKVPVIVRFRAKEFDLANIKFLVNKNHAMSDLMFAIRAKNKSKLSPEEAVFVFIGKTIPAMGHDLGALYKEHISEDGFLYVDIKKESTFG